MRFSKKEKREKSFSSWLILFLFFSVFFFLVVFLIVSNIRMAQRRAELKVQIKEREDEISRIIRSAEEGEESYSDEYILEKIARDQFLMKKEGEEVVFINFPEEILYEDEELEKEQFIWWNPLTWRF